MLDVFAVEHMQAGNKIAKDDMTVSVSGRARGGSRTLCDLFDHQGIGRRRIRRRAGKWPHQKHENGGNAFGTGDIRHASVDDPLTRTRGDALQCAHQQQSREEVHVRDSNPNLRPTLRVFTDHYFGDKRISGCATEKLSVEFPERIVQFESGNGNESLIVGPDLPGAMLEGDSRDLQVKDSLSTNLQR
jgi:hypothetical protein